MMTPTEFTKKFEDINLPLNGVRLPSFEIESKYRERLNLPPTATNLEFLRALALDGFKNLNLDKKDKDYVKYTDRAKYELGVINDLGFVDYILLVWSVINYCDENSIPVGLGRGSAAGSLILYLIGVTKIDPIRYGLYFERFISKIRAKKQVVDGITYLDGSLMCDVDMDICYYSRPKVLAHLEEKFKGRTSKILTLNTLSGKLLIKEVGKTVMEKSESEMTEVSNMIPKKYGIVRDIKETYEGVKNKDGTWKEEPVKEFVEWCDANPEIYQIALKLRNLIKNKGVHASGVMLSYDLMEESCPVELSSDKDPVSSFDMSWVSLLNVKLDCLGLRGVSVVDDACKSLGIKISDIDLNDPFIYQQLQDFKHPHGLFQIEAETNYRVCQHVKPKNLEELSGVLALARPGALQFVDQYANFTCNGVYEPIHPLFDEILKDSGGVVLYQEQLMQMANKVGFTLDEAEILRRIIGKKKTEEMVEWEQKLRNKIKENNHDPKLADILWKISELLVQQISLHMLRGVGGNYGLS
jgi:DNA polymerase-3 subunit alpha